MRDGLFGRVGHQSLLFVNYMGNLALFLLEACRTLSYPPWFLREVVAQMYQLGVKSFPLVAVASFSTGLVLAMQTVPVLEWFGASNYIATSVGLSFTKELGPVLAGIMLAARGGAGIGAELGSMRVTHQIDAITVTAINPMKYLVMTRIMACMLVLPLLAVFSDLIGILGGLVIGVFQVNMTPTYYYTLTIKYMKLGNVLPGIGKTAIFGIIIGTVASYHGYTTAHGTFGVGQATKISVVSSILLILVSDVFLTKLILIIWPS